MRPTLPIGMQFVSPTASPRKTIIVLGAYRGGTSLVASMLRNLGVPMGCDQDTETTDYDNCEDDCLSGAIIRRDWADFGKSVERRNAEHDMWGWKYPGTIEVIDDVLPHVRDPHVISIHRDPVAIMGRERWYLRVAHGNPLTGRLAFAESQNSKLAEFIERCEAPLLCLSMERAKNNEREARKMISDFTGKSICRIHP